jgi:hypothetical protein
MKTCKKLTSLLLAAVFLLALLPAATSPAVAITGGFGSNGKFLAPTDPPVAGSIPISNRTQLVAIASNLSGSFHLTADIDLGGMEWIPIGDDLFNGNCFTGIFDGQGYMIRNLTITGNYSYAGLFGVIHNAKIRNVGLEGTYINTSDFPWGHNAGGICGMAISSKISNCFNTGNISARGSAGGIIGSLPGGLTNSVSTIHCTGNIIIHSYNTGNISASQAAGGISGHGHGVIISDSYNTGDVSGGHVAGGICATANNSTINNCYNIGNVLADSYGGSYAGGICGAGTNSTISNCYNAGNIMASGGSSSAGGICGKLSNDSSIISNCYNTGTVSASDASDTFGYAGGICGDAGGININNVYNTGGISVFSANPYVGGICAFSSINSTTSTFDNCYWNIDSDQVVNGVSRINENKRGLGDSGADLTTSLTTAQMKQPASFAGFDFDNVWSIDPNINNGFPTLRVFEPTPPASTRSISLTEGVITFAAQTVGYSQPTAQSTTITNTGNVATGQLTVTAPANFQVSIGQTGTFSNSIDIASIAVDETATFWTRPVLGLATGTYMGNIAVVNTTTQSPALSPSPVTREVNFTVNAPDNTRNVILNAGAGAHWGTIPPSGWVRHAPSSGNITEIRFANPVAVGTAMPTFPTPATSPANHSFNTWNPIRPATMLGGTGDWTSTAQWTEIPSTALVLAVTPSSSTATIGQEIAFTISMGAVTNLGAFSFDINLPDGLTYVAGSGAIAPGFREAIGHTTVNFDQTAVSVSGWGAPAGGYTGPGLTIATFRAISATEGSRTATLTNTNFFNVSFAPITTHVNPALVMVNRVRLGHVRGADTISILDVEMTYQAFRGRLTLSDDQFLAANITGGDRITILDVEMIYQAFRGRITLQ